MDVDIMNREQRKANLRQSQLIKFKIYFELV